jgi:hypothetical protein
LYAHLAALQFDVEMGQNDTFDAVQA